MKEQFKYIIFVGEILNYFFKLLQVMEELDVCIVFGGLVKMKR